jgi:hypothetical protein
MDRYPVKDMLPFDEDELESNDEDEEEEEEEEKYEAEEGIEEQDIDAGS